VTEGDVSGPRPGIFELLARSKWCVPSSGTRESAFGPGAQLRALVLDLVELTLQPLPARPNAARDAWNSRQNMTTDEAMAAYVDVLLKVRVLHALDPADWCCARSVDRQTRQPLRQMLKRYKDRQEARDIINEFRQARAMAASSSFAGSQDWQSTSASSRGLRRRRARNLRPPARARSGRTRSAFVRPGR
jgi:uncharacterized membrane protein